MPEKDQQPGGGGEFLANTKKNYVQTVTNEQGEKEREQNWRNDNIAIWTRSYSMHRYNHQARLVFDGFPFYNKACFLDVREIKTAGEYTVRVNQ